MERHKIQSSVGAGPQSQVLKSDGHRMGVFGLKQILQVRGTRSERIAPRERSEALLERSAEARDCKQHTTQTGDCS